MKQLANVLDKQFPRFIVVSPTSHAGRMLVIHREILIAKQDILLAQHQKEVKERGY